MSSILRPAIALPEPLRASEIPSFTNYSVVVRLPDIARRTINENKFSSQTTALIEALIAEIPGGKIRQVVTPLAPDSRQWAEYIRPYESMNWLDVPWFFAEEYFYLRILEATGYYQAGAGQGRDPYADQKRLGLASSREPIREMADQLSIIEHRSTGTQREMLARMLLIDLWGNQNDLSLWPVQRAENGEGLTGGKAGQANSAHGKSAQGISAQGSLAQGSEDSGSGSDYLRAAQTNILTNDLTGVLDFIESLPSSSARVDILLDNAGYELVCDLALADFLLTSQHAAQVTLHAKSHPVFVSDVIEKDLHDTLDFMVFSGHLSSQALAVRLRNDLVSGRLVYRNHPFWTSPLAAWDMPDDLTDDIRQADLLIAKGDANYRRLLGDRHWPINLPFSQVIDYLPCAVLALRTLKSEIAVGIDLDHLPTTDPEWMINGRWGLVQFALSRQG